MPEVRAAAPTDRALIARITAAGFYDDPVMSWALRDDGSRLDQLRQIFGDLVDDMLPDRGLVHLADDASAALWRDPSFDHAGGAQGGGDPPSPAAPSVPFLPEELERFGLLGEAMAAAHPHEPHWYLFVVSTLPERQGQGLGAAVLQPVLARADREAVPAYLESTSPRNLSLYRRHGFVETGEIALPDGPSLTQMWREPRAALDG